jgi:hypothetical protein
MIMVLNRLPHASLEGETSLKAKLVRHEDKLKEHVRECITVGGFKRSNEELCVAFNFYAGREQPIFNV